MTGTTRAIRQPLDLCDLCLSSDVLKTTVKTYHLNKNILVSGEQYFISFCMRLVTFQFIDVPLRYVVVYCTVEFA